MSNPHLATYLALPALMWAALQVIWYWPRLPVRMASHFNIRLRPDGWMNKRYFVLTYVATMIGMAILMAFTTPLVLPALYYLAGVFHLAFQFNVEPERERLSGLIWPLTAVFVLAMLGIAFLAPQLFPPG